MNTYSNVVYFMNMPLQELCAFVEDYNAIMKEQRR